ncbi:hypothetical protein DVH24_028569 [Malus domestica]|uniref:Uncharacterized protein n=1 Tax=Malus domestica TaxID=3750 RepID=A0A498IUQ9_MALDO|nr:hypothetical protein DVH24_028569 [Malus domestica]
MARFWWGSDPDALKIHWWSRAKLSITIPCHLFGMQPTHSIAPIVGLVFLRRVECGQWRDDTGVAYNRSLLRPNAFKVLSVAPVSRKHMKVQELLDLVSKSWQLEVISNLFLEEEVKLVRIMPISFHMPADRLILNWSEFRQVNTKPSLPKQPMPARWQALRECWFKINVDGATRFA